MFRIDVFEFCVCAFVCFLLSALVVGAIGFSIAFTGVEDISVQGVHLTLHDFVQNFVQSVDFFSI